MSRLEHLDHNISTRMRKVGIPALRISFAIIFVWFGILKPLGLSAAAPLLKATVVWLPFGTPELWLQIIGWWEVLIGLCFLFRSTTRIAILLLLLQMGGTFMPMLFLPEVVYQKPWAIYLPTIEGQYIIKNVMIISAALVIGGTVTRKNKKNLS